MNLTARYFSILSLLLLSTHLYAQVIDDIGSREELSMTTVNEEYSGLCYYPVLDIFISILDDPIPGISGADIQLKGFNRSDNSSFNIGFMNESSVIEDDLESITYLEDNYFVMMDERRNDLYFLEYSIITGQMEILSIVSLLSEIPINQNNAGVEGMTYDPHTERLFFTREHFPRELFSVKITLPTTNTDGVIGQTFLSVDLPITDFNDPFYDQNDICEPSDKDASGLHHMGQNYAEDSPHADHILIVSEGNRKILEYQVNIVGNTGMNVTLVGEEFITEERQPEGITMVQDNIYIVSERGCDNNPNDQTLFNEVSLSRYGCTSKLLLKAFLEGPYDVISGSHHNKLNSLRRLLPGQSPQSQLVQATASGQPYQGAPWNYSGLEGINFQDYDYGDDDVDWVLVSLRLDQDVSSTVMKLAGIIQRDGSIRVSDCMALPDGDAFFIVVEHRNHLPIMSPSAIPVVNGVLVFDFTTQDSFTYPASFGQKELMSGIWTAFAGNTYQGDDFNGSDDINIEDKSVWYNLNGTFDLYHEADHNLDGDINGSDKSLWLTNSGIATRVNFSLD